MEEDFRSELFRYLGEEFPNEAVEEYKNRRLSVEEMREIFENRNKENGCHACYYIDLKTNQNTGLLYAAHDFRYCDDLLTNHIIAEQMFAQKDKVDWVLMTNGYEKEMVDKYVHLLDYPLVWLPTEDVGMQCVVVGKVAKEVYPPDRYHFDDNRYWFRRQLYEQGLLWFADTLPTKNDIRDASRYDDVPEDMILWDRLLGEGMSELRRILEFIIEKRGYAIAVKIVELFREDWDSIVTLHLFNLWRWEDFKVDRYRSELFERMEPYLKNWKARAQKELEEKQAAEAPQPRGRKESTLFNSLEKEAQETQRFLTFLRNNEKVKEEIDASTGNEINRIAICFFRMWRDLNYLQADAGGTALTRFMNKCDLKITIKEKAHSNALNGMISTNTQYYPWTDKVHAEFKK